VTKLASFEATYRIACAISSTTRDDELRSFFGKGESGGAGDAGKRTSDQDYGRFHVHFTTLLHWLPCLAHLAEAPQAALFRIEPSVNNRVSDAKC
jgi:hypothetical protein